MERLGHEEMIAMSLMVGEGGVMVGSVGTGAAGLASACVWSREVYLSRVTCW